MSLNLLDKLGLGLELFSLVFELVKKFSTLPLLFLDFGGGSLELSSEENYVILIIVVVVLMVIDLFETLDKFVGLIVSDLFLVFYCG